MKGVGLHTQENMGEQHLKLEGISCRTNNIKHNTKASFVRILLGSLMQETELCHNSYTCIALTGSQSKLGTLQLCGREFYLLQQLVNNKNKNDKGRGFTGRQAGYE